MIYYMKTLGVVGLGIMGHGIAANALKAGHRTVLWNRTKSKANNLLEQGAVWVETPTEAARQADIIFEVTANDESSKQVWLESDGILSGANRGKVLITSATLSVKWIEELAQHCKKQGCDLIDMPMTGGRVAAEGGFLTLLAGGDKQVIKELEPELQGIAKEVVYFGPVGSGTKYKLLLNTLQALHLAGFAEVMKIAKAVGLDEKTVGEALVKRPGGVLTEIAWDSYRKLPEPITFSVDWITKDLEYASEMAKNQPHELMAQVTKLYEELQRQNRGSDDWGVITKH
jgi:3-hydroxyisobutyrate dehydrogenase-like beta-hydroxyacid dehydrogenase